MKGRRVCYSEQYLKFILLFFLFVSQVFGSTGDIFESTGSIELETPEIEAPEIEIPDFDILFQRPSYILEKDTIQTKYHCDQEKESCKINFKLVNTETQKDISSRYKCHINLGFENDQSERCNPNTIVFPKGEHTVVFKVYDKNNITNKKETTIAVINPEIPPNTSIIEDETLTQSGTTQTGSLQINETGEIDIVTVPDPIIDFQSGGEYTGTGEIWTCKKQDCKINLTAVSSFTGAYQEKDYVCHWDFGGGTFQTQNTDEKCNPGYVSYGSGSFDIIFSLVHKSNPEKRKTKKFTILNLPKQNEVPQPMSENLSGSSGFSNTRPSAKISLQGKVGKEKSITQVPLYKGKIPDRHDGDGYISVLCDQVERCNINLDGRLSQDPDSDILEYQWSFGNGDFYEGKNPKAIWYQKGNYVIHLRVVDIHGAESNDYLFLDVVGKRDESISGVDSRVSPIDIPEDNQELGGEQYDFSKLKIDSVLVNPDGHDTDTEYIVLKNTGYVTLNLKGIILDDEQKKGSKPYLITQDVFLEPQKTLKFYRSETKLVLGNKKDSVSILHNENVIDAISWDFPVPIDYILDSKTTQFLEHSVKVLRVIDGDTIVIQFQNEDIKTLRLIGVDTPETKHPKKKVEYFGKEASAFTKQYLEGKQVILKQDLSNYQDKYKRLLGYIYLEDSGETLFFNRYLVEQGYARAYLRFPFQYSLEFEKAEKKAKKEKLGMWEFQELQQEVKKLEQFQKIQEVEKNISFKSMDTFVLNEFDITQAPAFVNSIKQKYSTYTKKQMSKGVKKVSSIWSEDRYQKNLLQKKYEKKYIVKKDIQKKNKQKKKQQNISKSKIEKENSYSLGNISGSKAMRIHKKSSISHKSKNTHTPEYMPQDFVSILGSIHNQIQEESVSQVQRNIWVDIITYCIVAVLFFMIFRRYRLF